MGRQGIPCRKRSLAFRRVIAAILILTPILVKAGEATADPLTFQDVRVTVDQGFTRLDLFSNIGKVLPPVQGVFQGHRSVSFFVGVSGVLPPGTSDTLQIATALYVDPQHPITKVDDDPIPFGDVFPPFTTISSFLLPFDCCFQPTPMSVTIDLLNSTVDYVIPSGPDTGQVVDAFTFAFYVQEPVPEPSTLLLLGSGLTGLGGFTWRRMRK